jgi:hypothetical protein
MVEQQKKNAQPCINYEKGVSIIIKIMMKSQLQAGATLYVDPVT